MAVAWTKTLQEAVPEAREDAVSSSSPSPASVGHPEHLQVGHGRLLLQEADQQLRVANESIHRGLGEADDLRQGNAERQADRHMAGMYIVSLPTSPPSSAGMAGACLTCRSKWGSQRIIR